MTKEQEKWIEYYDLEEESDELERLGLIPDHSEEAKEKVDELLARKSDDYSYEELLFLGHMDLQKLQKKSKKAAEEYMDL